MDSQNKKGCGCLVVVLILVIVMIVGGVFLMRSCSEDKAAAPVGFASTTTASAVAAASDAADFRLPDSVFKPRTPVRESDLQDAINWAKSEFEAIQAERETATEDINIEPYREAFKEANALYKSGQYEQALSEYTDILEQCPTHLGARNNRVLAHVQLQQYDVALKDSILLGLLHPSYEGNWVNIQIPLYGMGFDESSYASKLSEAGLPGSDTLEEAWEAKTFSDYVAEAYAYNRVYGDMESAMDKDAIQANFAELKAILQNLAAQESKDTDYSELLAYLEGLQKIRTKSTAP
jgi:tetratricopeptide (TPR) repeat protein